MGPSQHTSQTFSFHIPRKELVRVFYRRLFRRPGTIGVVLFISGVTIHLFFRDRNHVPAIIAGLILIGFLFLSYCKVVRSVRSSEFLTDHITCTFDADCLTFVASTSTIVRKWKFYRRYSEDERYLYLWVSSARFETVIPKSAMNVSQLDSFRQCMRILKD